MKTSLDKAFQTIGNLVTVFDANKERYFAASYSEAQARVDFIDQFWVALGWDVRHDKQTNPYQQEVKVERPVNTGAGNKRADYAFYLAPDFNRVRFFVEAKKPRVELETPDNYFQTIRYGWSNQNPLAVLHDFEQLHILDCRYRPDIETSLTRAVQKYHYSEYSNHETFAKIYWLFSREAIADGSLEKYVETMPKPRGKTVQRALFSGAYQSIDDAFLQELDSHRTTLARSFKATNPQLDSETLTEVTQRTLDRLVFMRFLEDKLIEPQHFVADFGLKGRAWDDFIKTSKRLDNVYNGIIFKPHRVLDDAHLQVDDSAFSDIRDELSHVNSPYDFNAIPIHILGSIYERFLGKVIVVEGDSANVQEKPEVRKAGGVYYTPDYIVRYIVQNTVGKMIEGKTPDEIAQMRFADIACGSGSFLLGVYDELLRAITTYYNANKREAKRAGCVQTEDGGFRLSLWQKREILTNNIYGVDIDAQAIEVTQMSLFLKLLDEETTASAHAQRTLQGAVLPSLDKNIVCGNSLVDWDILDGHLFEPTEERKLNPMSYAQKFPQIMRNGGFDAIVGNPPWVDIKGTNPLEVRYYFSHYSTVENRMNIYAVFMQKAIELLKPNGQLGYITPSSFLTQSSYLKLRELLLGVQINEIIRTPDRVFKGVVAETAVSIYTKSPAKKPCFVMTYAPEVLTTKLDKSEALAHAKVEQKIWQSDSSKVFNLRFNSNVSALLNKIESHTQLQGLYDFSLGLTPYDKYKGHTAEQISSRAFHATSQLDKSYKKILEGGDIKRYVVKWGGKEWIKYGAWLGAPREQRFFTKPRIVIRQIVSGNPLRIYAAYTNEELYNSQSGFSLVKRDRVLESDLYMLAIINSSLLNWYHQQKFLDLGKITFQKILIQDAKQFPIRAIDFTDKSDKARHDKMVNLVEQMMTTKRQLTSAQTDRDRNYYENKCAQLDTPIDNLVYELYELTADEIALVEGA